MNICEYDHLVDETTPHIDGGEIYLTRDDVRYMFGEAANCLDIEAIPYAYTLEDTCRVKIPHHNIRSVYVTNIQHS